MNESTRANRARIGTASLLKGAMITSRLGFGTSTLMGRVSAADSRRALDAAFAAGITHFDTARYYGFGDAERVVGQFLRDKRDRVTVVTKAGILPPRRSTALSALRAVARGAVAVAPALRKTLRASAARAVARGRFDSASVRSSLETSLRELSTDCVDVLLLHECALHDLTDELFDVLQSFVVAGKIRAFGTGTQASTSREIILRHNRFAPIVQVANSVAHPMLMPSIAKSIITHSMFTIEIDKVAIHLSKREDLRALGISTATLARRAMLEYGLESNPAGITLFSSTNPAHIAENVRNSLDRLFHVDELNAIADAIGRA